MTNNYRNNRKSLAQTWTELEGNSSSHFLSTLLFLLYDLLGLGRNVASHLTNAAYSPSR